VYEDEGVYPRLVEEIVAVLLEVDPSPSQSPQVLVTSSIKETVLCSLSHDS
jgi:hypothetical protein